MKTHRLRHVITLILCVSCASTAYAQDARPDPEPASGEPADDDAPPQHSNDQDGSDEAADDDDSVDKETADGESESSDETSPPDAESEIDTPPTEPTIVTDAQAESETDPAAPPAESEAAEATESQDSPPEPLPGVYPLQDGLSPVSDAPQRSLGSKRDRPEYDGVPKRTTVGQALLWVPRVILFPLFVVSEYVIRKPIGAAVTGIEKNLILEKFRHYTTIGERDGEGVYAGVNPIARFDSGFRIAVGLLFWAERVGTKDSETWIGVDTDFVRNATVDVGWKIASDRLSITPRFLLEQRDDFRFYGVGLDAPEEQHSRFFRRKLMGELTAELEAPSPGFGARLSTEISSNDFDCSNNEEFDICGPDGAFGNDDDRVGAVAGFDGYGLARVKARIYADSRPERPGNGTGARAELFARWGQGLSDDISFLRGGGELSLFWDIFQQRVIGLRVHTETTFRDVDVPFAELILLGGPELMRGFSRGRFHGASAFVASLDYRYPIWSLADGTIFFEAGNAYDDLDEIDFAAMRGSFGIGIRSVGSRHVSFDALVAAGTTQFNDADFGVESVRLSIGTNWGF